MPRLKSRKLPLFEGWAKRHLKKSPERFGRRGKGKNKGFWAILQGQELEKTRLKQQKKAVPLSRGGRKKGW